MEKRITFKIKLGYYLERLMPETMKSLGSTKSKVTKNENVENMSHLEITEVVLIHFILLMTIINKIKSLVYIFCE